MLKVILDKKKREAVKDNIDVVFAVITIVSFVASKVQSRRGEGTEVEEGEQSCEERCS